MPVPSIFLGYMAFLRSLLCLGWGCSWGGNSAQALKPVSLFDSVMVHAVATDKDLAIVIAGFEKYIDMSVDEDGAGAFLSPLLWGQTVLDALASGDDFLRVERISGAKNFCLIGAMGCFLLEDYFRGTLPLPVGELGKLPDRLPALMVLSYRNS